MNVLRLTIKLALLLTIVCALPIAFIRAQPYDDSDLRAFLTPPDGCPAPCFMGIRPGVTPIDDAIAILQKQASFQGYPPLPSWSSLHWYWNDPSLRWVDQQTGGVMNLAGHDIDYLEIRTLARIGDLRLVFGAPDVEQYRPWVALYGGGSAFQYSAWYADKGIEIIVSALCPISPSLFNFSTPTIFRLRSTPPRWIEESTVDSCVA